MSKKVNKDLLRISINLPKKLIDRIKNYAEFHGLNFTTACIVLLNDKLDTTNF